MQLTPNSVFQQFAAAGFTMGRFNITDEHNAGRAVTCHVLI